MYRQDKLHGIKPGDRVRVTFEGVVIRPDDDGLWLTRDGLRKGDEDWWGPLATGVPTFKIERIEPPLTVGDRVRKKYGREEYFVLAIAGENVWCGESLQPDLGQCWSSALSDLESIA